MHSDDSVRCLLPCLPGEGRDPVLPWAPAFQGVTQSRNLALSLSRSSFPRKREPRDFSRLLLGPRFRGDDELTCPQDFLTASFAGKTRKDPLIAIAITPQRSAVLRAPRMPPPSGGRRTGAPAASSPDRNRRGSGR